MTRGGVPGAVTRPGADGPLPAGAPLVAPPHPATVAVEGARDLPRALGFAEGPAAARAAFASVSTLSARLFPGEPPLFAEAGGMPAEIDAAGRGVPLRFDRDGVRSPRAVGFRYALITLGQILRGARLKPGGSSFPASGRHRRCPRFGSAARISTWRGRSMTRRQVRRFIDCLAWNKMNVFHFHLSDDEGWRLDIPEYPELADVAAWRGYGLAVPPLLGSGRPLWRRLFAAEIGALVAPADALGIAIVPEIDIPGHCYCVLQAIPSLRDPGETGVYRSIQGFPNNALNPAVGSYQFLEAVFATSPAVPRPVDPCRRRRGAARRLARLAHGAAR